MTVALRFEQSIDIDATQQRVWDVLTDLESWPRTVDTVETIEILTTAPIGVGTRVRLKQPKLPEGTFTVNEWSAPSFFEWTQKANGVTSVAGHRVEALGPDRARLLLTLEMRGLMISIVGRFYDGLVRDYLQREANGMKAAAESS